LKDFLTRFIKWIIDIAKSVSSNEIVWYDIPSLEYDEVDTYYEDK